jgi:putative lipoprotein
MIRVLAVVALLNAPPGDPWFGADKLKHFLMSAMIQSAAFSMGRTMNLDKPASQMIGAGAVASLGLWKEVRDRRLKRGFSTRDLIWDFSGAASAAALLNGTR